MDSFIINGGKQLKGEIKVSGAKNAVLPLMAAALLSPGESIIENVPNLIDLKTMSHLLRVIGARIEYNEGRLSIDASNCNCFEAPYDLVSKMRASIYVLGPLLGRFHQATVSFPGGCAIGSRPVDLHLTGFEKLGAKIEIKHGNIIAECKGGLKGAEIVFPFVSVGATANLLMGAVLAEGITTIKNAALEPEITHLIDFLNAMGAKIEGKNTNTLVIQGVKELKPTKIKVIADRIEAGTFVIAAAITKSPLKIVNCNPEHLQALFTKLEQAGCHFRIEGDTVLVLPAEVIKPVDVVTEPFPSFPTDLQAQFMAYMTLADGVSHITETIYPDRFLHAAELNRLNADISVKNGTATVSGVKNLSGAKVMATDLRASAALVLAGLVAEGQTTISRIYHIDRGYDKIEEKLSNVGADIQRIIM
ncbi:MAG: UDP-N-acetylglucosamine 1-carboxyvinyltransferase [Candidatus Cloacimonadales bacterium]|jgi:UDP-N-acetylglucosamine 1-carboxyvinyltransferase|nr:UDP-N-acetylglucosamine 1-carboxyvinyltransferase [Candidatus Cloacimonadota bacterium]MDD3501177.1 UDP-N-acetylglucosamine 1-carboxyvinyltransferase [Candidatus Cloacimonadota bacterium]MDX9977751.1 UDP-N-acetylglucosamine 1-carboxyvinyltransferase [Candidatus Cloacimonadales bacterium]